MSTETTELRQKHCMACEEATEPMPASDIRKTLRAVPDWTLTPEGKSILREWTVEDFSSGLEFFKKIGDLAEAEGHHPDLHLTGYRNVSVELLTHSVDGLTENDFILAAKIDAIPVRLKK